MPFKIFLFWITLLLGVWIVASKQTIHSNGISKIDIPQIPKVHAKSKKVKALLTEAGNLLKKYKPKLESLQRSRRSIKTEDIQILKNNLRKDTAVLNQKLMSARQDYSNNDFNQDASVMDLLFKFVQRMIQLPGQISCLIIGQCDQMKPNKRYQTTVMPDYSMDTEEISTELNSEIPK